MRKIEIYKCKNCGSFTHEKRVDCLECGSSFIIQGIVTLYRTSCCDVTIGENVQFCPQCGGIENGE